MRYTTSDETAGNMRLIRSRHYLHLHRPRCISTYQSETVFVGRLCFPLSIMLLQRKVPARNNVGYTLCDTLLVTRMFCYCQSITKSDVLFFPTVYSSTCHERTPSGPGKSVRTLQVAARHRDGWAGGGRTPNIIHIAIIHTTITTSDIPNEYTHCHNYVCYS